MRMMQNKGQSTLELAILFSVIILALVALQSYIKFAGAGRLKSSADSISQTLFNPHAGTTKLTIHRVSTDVTTGTPADRLGVGAGLNTSTTATDADDQTVRQDTLP